MAAITHAPDCAINDPSAEPAGICDCGAVKPATPRFAVTGCSQCGGTFGPGDHGFSHCEHHMTREQKIETALAVFVNAYADAADPIGDSDLDDEQPRHVTVKLGDCRRAASLLGIHPIAKRPAYIDLGDTSSADEESSS